MTRRTMLTALAALAGRLSLGKVTAEEPGYLFDFHSDELFTDDPEWVGRLKRGHHNRVLIDGKCGGAATRFFTGPNGWVETLAKGPDGEYILDFFKGDLVKSVAHGRVVFAPYPHKEDLS